MAVLHSEWHRIGISTHGTACAAFVVLSPDPAGRVRRDGDGLLSPQWNLSWTGFVVRYPNGQADQGASFDDIGSARLDRANCPSANHSFRYFSRAKGTCDHPQRRSRHNLQRRASTLRISGLELSQNARGRSQSITITLPCWK